MLLFNNLVVRWKNRRFFVFRENVMNIREPDRIEKRLLLLLRFGVVVVTMFEMPRILVNKCVAKIAQRKETAKQEQILKNTLLLFAVLGHGESPYEDNKE